MSKDTLFCQNKPEHIFKLFGGVLTLQISFCATVVAWQPKVAGSNMTPLGSVRQISDVMHQSGKGSIEKLAVKADVLETFGVKGGNKYCIICSIIPTMK